MNPGERMETDGAPVVAKPSRAWRHKDTLYLGLGSLLLIGGILGLTVIGTSQRESDYVLFGTVLCSATGIVPGAILLLLGWRARKEERSLVAFAAWIKTY